MEWENGVPPEEGRWYMNVWGLLDGLWSFVGVLRGCVQGWVWRVGVCGKRDGRMIEEDGTLRRHL